MNHNEALAALRPFLSRPQFATLLDLTSATAEEHPHFRQTCIAYAERIANMPATYGQDGKGDDATVYLHYFVGGSDWYITEKDMDGGVDQAFGFAILNGDTECAELGYISIRELAGVRVELDLHFEPTTLREIKRKHGIPCQTR